MKIAVIFFIGLLAYAVVAKDDKASDKAGEPSIKHLATSNQNYGYQSVYYAPTRRPQSAIQRFFASPIGMIFLFQLLTRTTAAPTTTTTEPPTTTESTTMDVTTPETTTPIVTTTTSPYADWVNPGDTNCRYEMQKTTATYTAAKLACEDMGAKLACAGFSGSDSAKRSTLISGVGGDSLSFWIDAMADESTTTTGTIDDTTDKYGCGISNPSADGITLTLQTGESGTGLCGRFPADNVDELIFEDCGTRSFFYLCEYCGSIGR